MPNCCRYRALDVVINHRARALLKSEIDAHKMLVSPMRRMPPYILLPPHMILGCICRNWRSLAYSTPRIWTSIWSSLHIPSLTDSVAHRLRRSPRYGSEVATDHSGWLDRSATCPPSISRRLFQKPRK
ncbi:hypothetical protein C8R43DRAFT_568776 [Mycena crocata]|nr:hypothetical protein C8R43DRAFT_568776 [Mycena crocata]